MPERLPLPRLAAGAILLLLPPLLSGRALAQDCPGADGAARAVVARLVSVEGVVLIDGRPPAGTMPRIAICPGSTLEVGRDSRVAVYLNEARTPLQLEESTRVQFQPPAEPGSGLIELARGAVYFLSEVRRTLTVRTPYVTAGIEGTEVYLRVDEPEAAAELIVLEGRVAVGPAPRNPDLEPLTATTGERVEVASDGAVARTSLPSDGTPFGALRRVTVGQLAWTLFYPDVLAGTEAQGLPRITEAARLLAAGQVAEAEALLANVPDDSGREAGLRDALRATIAFARKDAGEAQRLADRAIAAAPDAAAPRLAASYARQLALDLDGAVAAGEAAVAAAPRAPLPQARLAELRLMRGETRAARRAAAQAQALGGGPLAEIVLGYAELAALRGRAAEGAFLRALAQESRNPLALLGLGLAEIKQGRLVDGTQQIESAVVHDPSSSLLRSYLGKAYFEDRRDASAGTQLAIAKDLDPSDPTPWFYDAIRKQLGNRPVEALRDLERSIALNDNRAPFRSRLLLDQDRAIRGIGLGRIYQDLGFEALGRFEAAASQSIDPASSPSRRLLSDLFATDPRYELARASELLLSQLLQPSSRALYQPSLSLTDLKTVAALGPTRVSFNEFSPLYERDGIQLVGTGLAGTDATLGNEISASVLKDRYALSVGQSHFESDGFRPNNDIEHDILGVLAQADTVNGSATEIELRRRETRNGDRLLGFDPDDFIPSLRERVNSTLVRLGGRHTEIPGVTLLASGIIEQRNTRASFAETEGFGLTDDNEELVTQGELQSQFQIANSHILAGAGAYRVGRNRDFTLPCPTCDEDVLDYNATSTSLYGLANHRLSRSTTLTGGFGYTKLNDGDIEVSGLTPSLGLQWQPLSALRFRLAAFRSISPVGVIDQTIEPTNVVAIPRYFDDFPASAATVLAGAAELRIAPRASLTLEAMYRDLSSHLILIEGPESSVTTSNADDTEVKVGLHITPANELALDLTGTFAHFEQPDGDAGPYPTDIKTASIELSARYFAPLGLFAGTGVTLVTQDVERAPTAGGAVGTRKMPVLDAVAGYRLPGRRGLLSIEGRNLLDTNYNFQDTSFGSDRPLNVELNPRFAPSRTIIARLTLSF